MALPTYVASGTASSGTTSPRTPAYPAGLAANDRLILQVFVRATDAAVTTPSGWTYEFEDVVTGYGTQWTFSKLATGSESGTLSVAWSGTTSGFVAITQIHAFRGVTTASRWYEPGDFTLTIGGTTVNMPIVVTTGTDRLALALLAAAGNATVSAATGETGGNWIEALAEVTTTSGNGATLQLQTADLATAGTLSGGTSTLGTTVGGHTVRGMALIATGGTLSCSAPIFQGLTEVTAAASLTDTKGFIASAGDIVFAFVVAKDATAAVTAFANVPTDNLGGTWTLVHQNVSGTGPALRAAVFKRAVGVSSVKIDSISFTASSTPDALWIAIFTNSAGDINNLKVNSAVSTTGDPAITLSATPAADSTVMCFYGANGTGSPGTDPTGFTLIVNDTVPTHQRQAVYYDAVSPVQSATFSSTNTQSVGILVEIPLLSGAPTTFTGTGARTLDPLTGAASGTAPQTAGALDSYVTGLAQACDYRRVVSTYFGPILRVRRTTPDSTELDIGYNYDNSLDEAALLAFCGSGDGYLILRYNQSGVAERNQVGTPIGTGPRIVTAGVIERLNGNPCAKIITGDTEAEWTTTFASPYTGIPLCAVWAGKLASQTAADRLISLTTGTTTDYNGAGRAALIAVLTGGASPTLRTFTNSAQLGSAVAFTDGDVLSVSWRGDGTNATLKTALGSSTTAYTTTWNFNRIVLGQVVSANATERLNAGSFQGSAYLWFSNVSAANLETVRAEAEQFWSGAVVTGTAARTLNPLTGAASGTHTPFIGTAARTLAALTGAATGVHGVTGTAVRTLAALNGAATGTLGVSGTASRTVAALVGNASALHVPFIGTASRTLPPLTGAATGIFGFIGTGGRTLAPITGTAAGVLGAVATAARIIPPLDGFAPGIHSVGGVGARTLAPLTAVATAVHAVAGTASRTLAALTGVGAGIHAVGGSAAHTLAQLAGAATGTFTPAAVTGTAEVTVAPIVGNAFGAHGAAGVSGTAARTLVPITGVAVGIHAVGGAGAHTVAPLAGVASGSHGVAGAAVRTLAPLAGVATGTQAAAGTASRTLPALTGAATGIHAQAISGTGARTLTALDAFAPGIHAVGATGIGTLAPLAGAATARHGVGGTALVTVAPLQGAAFATYGGAGVTGTAASTLVPLTGAATAVHGLATGTAARTLASLAGVGTGVHGVVGTASRTLAAVTGAATAFTGQSYTGTASKTLAPLTGAAISVHGVAATAARILAPVTSAATAVHGIGGTAARTLAAVTAAASGSVTIVGTGAGVIAPLNGLATGVVAVVGAAAGTVAAVGHAVGIGAFTVVGEGSIELVPLGIALGHFEVPIAYIKYQECQLTGLRLTKENARYDTDRRAYVLDDVFDDPEPPPRRPPTAAPIRLR